MTEVIYDSAGAPWGVAGALWLDPSMNIRPRTDGSGIPLGGNVLGASSASVYVQDADTTASLASTFVFPRSVVNVASGIATFNFGYTRTLVVDSGGKGDYTSIGAALATASASATWAAPWLIEVGPGTYTENIFIPAGVTVRGSGPFTTILAGYADISLGGHLMGMECQYPSTSVTYGLLFNCNSNSAMFSVVQNVIVKAFGAGANMVAAVKCTGTGTGGILYVLGSYLYARNHYSGGSPGAEAAVFHLDSTFQMYAEFTYSRAKTSSGGFATPQMYFAKVDCVAPSTGFGYVHAEAFWEDVHGNGGVSPVPYLLKSLNTVHYGLLGAVDWQISGSWTATMPEPLISVAFATPTINSHYGRFFSRARVKGALDVGGVADLAGGINVGGTSVLTSGRVLQNVTANTSILNAGTLGYARGGTGLTTGSLATGGLLYGSAADTLSVRAIGASGTFLKSTGGVPDWASPGFSDLSGSLAYSQLPGAGGTWNAGGGTVAVTGFLHPSLGLVVNGTTVLDSARVLQNVTADASIITGGAFGYARLPNAGGTWNAGGGTVSLTGALTPSGIITAAGGISVTGGSFAAGRVAYTSTNGLIIVAKPASSYDLTIYNAAGSAILAGNPTGTSDWWMCPSAGARMAVGTGGQETGVTLKVTGDLGASGYVRAASGIRFTANDNYLLPGGASDRSALKSNSTTGVLMRYDTSDNTVRGYVGYNGEFGLIDSAGNFAVKTNGTRVALRGPATIDEGGTEWAVPKLVISTSAPSTASDAPPNTIWIVRGS